MSNSIYRKNFFLLPNLISKKKKKVGKKDQLVPPDHMEKLFKKTKSKTKVMKKFPNGEHMTVWVQPNYYETLKEFIDSVFDQ